LHYSKDPAGGITYKR